MPKLFTIGHSTHSLKEFIEILQTHKINHLVDIRAIPRSRYVPWFNKPRFMKSLQKANIRYSHMPKLGGLRSTNKNSINTAWRNRSFRGFADYMQTKEFFEGVKELNLLIKKQCVVIMCAEALPWRCHRSLIADAEIIRHISIWHIMGKGKARKHSLTIFAKINRNKKPLQISYPS